MEPDVREYGFELRLCAHLESQIKGIIARQIGGGVHNGARRILDIVAIEQGPEFESRCAITSESIPVRAITSDIGVGRARRWSRVCDVSQPEATRIRDRAVAVGFFENDQRRGSGFVRQTTRYPDWIGRITAIENKPDLRHPGDLLEQLRLDVSLGLVDRVVVATSSYVTGAHLHRIPDAVGIWRIDPSFDELQIEEIRPPTDLDPGDWGLELGEREPTARAIRPVSPAAKRRARIRLAERAYGKGWRPTFPACTEIRSGEEFGSRSIPYCDWYEQIVDPGGCGQTCPGYNPGDPPDVDHEGERANRSPWLSHPPGVSRKQAAITSSWTSDDGE